MSFRADWNQVIANGGPPCFYVEDGRRFCFRAERWDGHERPEEFHEYVSLESFLADLESRARLDERQAHDPCGCYQRVGEPRHVCTRCAALESQIKSWKRALGQVVDAKETIVAQLDATEALLYRFKRRTLEALNHETKLELRAYRLRQELNTEACPHGFLLSQNCVICFPEPVGTKIVPQGT